ncbi:MAG: 3-hydroxybutyryl-CoA dehydrogenase, partial [Oscillospiraceae bacterium]|nr:3-hydroxybutyryl-CoA dehydrogenase [Oscillospiraceae bacterium]
MNQPIKGIDSIAVIGPGLMGSGIAQVCAAGGYEVMLYGRHEDRLKAAIEKITASYDRNLARGRISAEERDEAINRIHPVTDLDSMHNCGMVIEAVSEDMALKQKIFGQLNMLCPKNTIFATNTSALSVSEIGEASGRSERFLGTHFFNPVHAMALV